MDCDTFAKAGRLGRKAADALGQALDGAPWDDFLFARMLEKYFSEAQGVPSLPDVLDLCDQLLFAGSDWLCDEVEHCVDREDAGTLDLVLQRVAQRRILDGADGGRVQRQENLDLFAAAR